MNRLIIVTIALLILGGCSGESTIAPDKEVALDTISGLEVLSITDGSSDLGDESLWIVCSTGARLLENKMGRYRSAGLTWTDLGRMPNNELTADLRRLFRDINAAR